MSAAGRDLLKPGDVFRGHVVEKALGRGGAGAVYLVRHDVLDMRYALKVLDASELSEGDSGVQRFLREARLATRIRHPNLVSVHDCGFDAERKIYFIVMDYAPGVTLRNVLAVERTLDVARAADVVAQVSMALQATQAYHVVHRDLKPENIMLQADGRVKVLDLGIAKAENLGDAVRTRAGTAFGTPAYIAPEQALSAADVDARADVYSLGVVFYEMLAGTCPYVGRTSAEILGQVLSGAPPPDVRDAAPRVGADVAALVRRMMAKNREARPASFDAVLAELRAMKVIDETSVASPAEVTPGAEGHRGWRLLHFWTNHKGGR